MKKIFYLLFIGTIAFGSCTKQDPVEVNITDTTFDENLIGHWKATGVSYSSILSNGQIDLNFFADGIWDIWGNNGDGTEYQHSGNYRTNSGNVLNIRHNSADGNKMYNYSINNGLLTITPISGQDEIWVMKYMSGLNYGTGVESVANPLNYAIITNLTKQ